MTILSKAPPKYRRFVKRQARELAAERRSKPRLRPMLLLWTNEWDFEDCLPINVYTKAYRI